MEKIRDIIVGIYIIDNLKTKTEKMSVNHSMGLSQIYCITSNFDPEVTKIALSHLLT